MTRLSPWPVVAVGAIVWKDDRVLLIRRGQPPRQGCWSIPGGRQEAGETVAAAAAREIHEETGVAIRVLGLAAVVDLIEHDGQGLAYHYTAVDLVAAWVDGDIRAGDDAADVAWVAMDMLDAYLLPEVQRHVIAVAAERRATLDPARTIGTVLS